MPSCVRRTFDVEPVELAHEPLPETSAQSLVEELVGHPVEAFEAGSTLVAGFSFHPLVASVHMAYQGHRPLVLTPDAIWITILQGMTQCISQDPEAARPFLVAHQDKRLLRVRLDHFVKGSAQNCWPEAFRSFQDQMAEWTLPEAWQILRARFSTTGPLEAAAQAVMLMSALQSYFDYEIYTMCGIPRITLEGSADDWADLRRRCQQLSAFGAGWWTNQLDPLLEQFHRAADGHQERRFWRNIYKIGGDEASGGQPQFNGWIGCFFPYLSGCRGNIRNYLLEDIGIYFRDEFRTSGEPDQCGPTHNQLPSPLASVPVAWQILKETHPMRFLAGLVGVEQNRNTLAVRPRVGWAVHDENAPRRETPPQDPQETLRQWVEMFSPCLHPGTSKPGPPIPPELKERQGL